MSDSRGGKLLLSTIILRFLVHCISDLFFFPSFFIIDDDDENEGACAWTRKVGAILLFANILSSIPTNNDNTQILPLAGFVRKRLYYIVGSGKDYVE